MGKEDTNEADLWVSGTEGKAGLREIRGTDIFLGLSPGDIVAILKRGKTQEYKEGTYVYRAQEGQEGLFFLKTGQVQEFRLTPEGHKLLLSQIGPGQFFGVASSRQGGYCCFAQAVKDCEAIFFSFKQLELVTRDYPQVAINLLRWFAGRVGDIEERFEAISFTHLRARVAQSLIELSRSQGSLLIEATQETVSTWVPASRSKVSLVLQDLQRKGALHLSRARIEILDMEVLRQQVEEGL